MTDATLTELEMRALEQVREAGWKGLLVERGWESVTQQMLVEKGLLLQEIAGSRHWKFTVPK